jgi:VCBS repeat-containing protein
MANFTGTSLDDVMGSGTSSAGTAAADRFSSGAGNDTFVYELASMGGADRFSGGTGSDTVEFRLTAAEWANPTIQNAIIAFKSAVDARVALAPGGIVAAGTGYTPLTFGINKSLTVLEAENVRVYANGELVLGVAAPTTAGFVKEAGVDLNYAALAGTPVATGLMPSTDLNGNPIPAGSTWTVGVVNVGAGLSPDIYSKLGTGNTGFSIDKTTGQWTYTLDNTDDDTQDLQNGQAIKMSFQAIATAPDGKSATFQNVVITLNGTNDIQTIAVSGSDFAVDERGGVNNATVDALQGGDGASGQLALTNVDNNPALTFPGSFEATGSATIKGTYGDLVVTRIGAQAPGTGSGANELTTATWSYTLRNNDANVQALSASDIKLDAIQLPAGLFDGANNTITVTVSGSEDAAVIGGGDQDLLVVEAGGFPTTPVGGSIAGDATAGGTFTQVDPDTTGPLFFAPLNNNPLVGGNRVDLSSTVGKYGDFTLNPTTGAWTYTLDNTRAATQALQEKWLATKVEDMTIVERLTVASSTDAGATKTITVVVLGRDDLTQDITNTASSDGFTVDEAFAGDKLAGGTLKLDDVDGQRLDYSATGLNFGGPVGSVSPTPMVVIGGSGAGSAQTFKGLYGDFAFDGNTGVWTYERKDTAGYLNSEELTAGQFGTDVMTVRSGDSGAFENVTVTVIGKDDTATFPSPSVFTGNVTEAGGPLTNTLPGVPTATGKVVVVDEDAGQSGWTTPAGPVSGGTYGTFTFSPSGANGNWSYSLDNTKLATEQLSAGQTATEKFTLTSTDGTTTSVTITVTGTNDHATISVVGTPDLSTKEFGGTNNLEFIDNGTGGGQLKVVDVDGVGAFNESRFRAASTTPGLTDLRGQFGDFTFNPGTGAWTYALNNLVDTKAELDGSDLIALAQINALQGLADGQPATDTLLVFSEDLSASLAITVNVEGTYDVASINNDLDVNGSQVVAEGTTRATTKAAVANSPVDYLAGGDLNPVAPSVVDKYNAPSASQLQGVYGVFTFNDTNGVWTYTLDNEDADTRALQPTFDLDGNRIRSAQDFLTVSNTATPTEVYTIAVDVFGAYTAVDLKGTPLPSGLNTPNLPGDLAANAAPVINGTGGQGSITFIARNGDPGETLSLHAGNPLGPLSGPWGTVTVNDGTLTTVTMPVLPATQLMPPFGGVINQLLHVWDGDTQTVGTAPAALNLGVSIAQGTVGRDTIVMIGNNNGFGGMASGYDEIDEIFGTDFKDFIDGGEGDDILTGDVDQFNVVGGNDTIVGGGGRDDIVGNAGDDVLWGGSGADTLAGDTGNDTLIGGTGRDLMEGGLGDNKFYFGTGPFNSSTEDDEIVDFSTSTDGFINTDKLWFAESLLLTQGYFRDAVTSNILLSADPLLGVNQWFANATTANILAENYSVNARFIFDNVNGDLYYDADGGGASSDPVLVVNLEIAGLPVNTLTPVDFQFDNLAP